MGRHISELVAAVPGAVVVDPDGLDSVVDDVTEDSRLAGEGVLFVAVRGESFDGHDFVMDALESGCPAVCVDHPLESEAIEMVVDDTRFAIGPLASAVHGHPSRSMNVIGVTGTNGKTTVTHYIESMSKSLGLKTGLIGTIVTRIAEDSIESIRTTPEAADFQRLLASMRDAGTEVVAVEVSSHALDLGRVASTEFGVAAFTNLSQDHLDFHGDMGSYKASKRRLFEEYSVGHAVFNVDDETGREFAEAYAGLKTTVGSGGDVHAGSLRARGTHTEFELTTPWGTASVSTPIVGRFNVDNALLAATCLLVSGYDFDSVVEALRSVPGVPGRFELVSGDDPIKIVVDYAHTPAGIEETLATARTMGSGRVLGLIGAGGDRDRTKRPLMGEAISTADVVVITSDNPRSEDPARIAAEVVSGVDSRANVLVELDRAEGIRRIVGMAADGDVVLILGRGHEPMQEIAGRSTPFDDRQVARRALEQRRKSAESEPPSGSMGP